MISERFRRAAGARLVLASAALLVGLGLGEAQASSDVVEFIEITGVIDPVSSRFLLRQIDRAEEKGSRAVIVRLDTPGGLDISMREIVQRVLGSKVPVVVWVAPSGARAASAGVFITYAAHVAAMAPGTNLGAAHPVNLGEKLDETTEAKVVNDAAAYLRAIAKQRGRNVEFAERAVRESASLDAEEAVAQDVADFTAGSLRALLAGLDGREVEVGGRSVRLSTEGVVPRFHKMGLLERILHSAIRPEIAYLVLLLGFYGLIFELYNPGIGASGVLGGVALILGFYALSVLPTSWAGVALLVLAVAFFLADLHTAGLGVFTAGGTVALVAGSLLLFAGAGPEFRLAWWAIVGAVASAFVFFISVMTAAIRARTARPISGAEGMIGTIGVARSDIAPDGRVMAKGTLWRARTVGAAIGEGSPVRILGVSGLMLMVEEAKGTEPGSARGGGTAP